MVQVQPNGITPEQFVYWLQGFAEVSDAKSLSEQEWTIIKDHLKEVFVKKTPDYQLNYTRTNNTAETIYKLPPAGNLIC